MIQKKSVFFDDLCINLLLNIRMKTLAQHLCLLVLIFLSIQQTAAETYYVSPNGSDNNNGSLHAPFASIQQAQTVVQPGDTVYLRGGTYSIQEAQVAKYNSIWAYVIYLDKSGTADAPICYWAYPGEQPILDFSQVKPADKRVHAFQVVANYLHIKGLEVVGVQVTITDHTQSECFHNEGSYNRYEQLKMHDGQAIGLYLTKGSYNLILNCDAWNNADVTSEDKRGGNTDGFGAHPSVGSVGNIFKGCRAWFNSDDGFDCISASEAVVFDRCWAYCNGYSPTFASMRDGNGFKIGGHGAAPNSINGKPDVVPAHTVTHCMAYRNKANGFYANHHIETGNTWLNNTAFLNKVNYNMLSQRIVNPGTAEAYTEDVPGLQHILYNNLSFSPTSSHTANMGSSTNLNNSFSSNIQVNVTSDDFVSIQQDHLMFAQRQNDGSLPDMDFLKLKPESDLIDKGKAVGLPFGKQAPDLGAFELKEQQQITFDSIAPQIKGATPFRASATASSGLSVTVESSDPSVVTVSMGFLLFRNPGTAILTARQGGSDFFYPAAPVSRVVTVLDPSLLETASKQKGIDWFVSSDGILPLNASLLNIDSAFSLYDLQGNKCMSGIVNAQDKRINLTNLPKGLYFIQTRSGRRIEKQKILWY